MRAVLQAQINKADPNDARVIAQMMRVGLYRPVHVKTSRSQKLRMLLTHGKLLQSMAIAVENDQRRVLARATVPTASPLSDVTGCSRRLRCCRDGWGLPPSK